MSIIVGIITPAVAGTTPDSTDKVLRVLTHNVTNPSAGPNEVDFTPYDYTMDDVMEYVNGNILAQDAFPELSTDEREQLISGLTPKDWEEMFDE